MRRSDGEPEDAFDSMLGVLYSQEHALAAAQQIKELVGDRKQIEGPRVECAAIRAWSKNNYLPPLWGHYRSHRQVLLRVIQSLRLEAREDETDTLVIWKLDRLGRSVKGLVDLVIELDNQNIHEMENYLTPIRRVRKVLTDN